MAQSLLRRLQDFKLPDVDAERLAAAYANESSFMADLMAVARMVELKKPLRQAPPGQPWHDIAEAILASLATDPDDYDSAWRNAIAAMSVDLQLSITAALNRGQGLVQAEQQARKKRIPTAQYYSEFASLGYTFRLNLCNDSIEITAGGTTERLSDARRTRIVRELSDLGYSSREETEDCITSAAYDNRYHPIREYLNSLTWDGGDYINQVAQHFTDEKDVFALYLRKWLVGAVAKAYLGVQTPMLVLDGLQDTGKSKFVEWLCPHPAWHTASGIDPDNKDDQVKLIETLVWEVTELGSTTRRADMEALKGFLTLEAVTVRLPYARLAVRKPALASFVGTVNNMGGVLNDPTGSRRFHVCKIMSINWDYTQIDKNSVWAEAVAAYRAGETWNLSAAEKQARNEINAEYYVEDIVEGLLLKYFVIDPAQSGWWLPTTDILEVLEDPKQGNLRGSGSTSNAMKLAATMTRLGLKGERRPNLLNQRVRGYCGIRRTP